MWVTVGSGEGKGVGVRVEGERFLVGTAPECQLMVGDPKVSPLHAYFEVRDGHVTIHDLGSDAGTYVDGERIDAGREVKGGEEIRVGDTLLVPTVDEPEPVGAAAGQRAAAVRVEREGQTVEVLPDREGEEGAVLVTTEGEAVEVIGAGERRRLRGRLRLALVAAGLAAAAAIAAIVVATTGSSGPSTADIVRYAKPRTVLVRALEGQQVSSGSGVVLNAGNGLVITNFHVVNGGTRFEVGVQGDLRPANIVGAAPCDDLAVLKVTPADGLKAFPLGSQSALSEGDHVVAVGFPANASLDTNLTSTDGVVSQVRTAFRTGGGEGPPLPDVVQTDAPLSPGNSGGPLIDSHERVVGLNTAILTNLGGTPAEGQGYAVGIDQVKQVAPALEAGRSVGWAGFGIGAVPRQVAAQRHMPPGVLAGPAAPGTPPADAALSGALITAINGFALDGSLGSYCAAVESISSGQTAAFTVLTRPGSAPRQVAVRFR